MANITAGMMTDTINGIKINSSIRCHSSNYTNCDVRDVKYIVLHYTGNVKDAAKANAQYFSGANRSASAHFFVDNNEVYQGVELRDYAWHCAGGSWVHPACRNTNSWGIEMCCSGNYLVSDKTKENAAYLTAHLCKLIGVTKNTVDTYVLRHYDTVRKRCPAQMAGENNAEWESFKTMVKNILSGTSATASASTTTDKLYRIRKSWSDSTSQLGAYKSLDNAIKDCKSGYKVYDSNGKQVYPKVKAKCSTVSPNVELPMIQKGSTGAAVKVLQTILGTPVTGTFNDADVKSFKEFQKNTNQTTDGVCGKNGWKAICEHLCANTYKS